MPASADPAAQLPAAIRAAASQLGFAEIGFTRAQPSPEAVARLRFSTAAVFWFLVLGAAAFGLILWFGNEPYVSVFGRGVLKRLPTRLYFADGEGNADDPAIWRNAKAPAPKSSSNRCARSAGPAFGPRIPSTNCSHWRAPSPAPWP